VQRRLYDYQFSLTQTTAEFEQVHQAFLHTYNYQDSPSGIAARGL